ncbi:MAG TPA: putative sulfate exporter family transporter, partial [Planctomycetes bacterium]|nr:putative sulfate exporter family transporter [Planctomycetota bacterium]
MALPETLKVSQSSKKNEPLHRGKKTLCERIVKRPRSSLALVDGWLWRLVGQGEEEALGFGRIWKGIALCAGIGGVGVLLAGSIPIGAVAIAILAGIVVGNVVRPGPGFGSGIQFCEKQLLSLAIALMGVNLDFGIVKELGFFSLGLVVAGVAVTIAAAVWIGKLLGFDQKFALLLGIGNGVCGSSAIAATEQIIGANEEEVGLSVAIVNGLGTVGIFVLPLVARSLFHFSDLDAGLLVGNTLQAVG